MKKLAVLLTVLVLIVAGCSGRGSVARSKWHIGVRESFSEKLIFNESGRSFAQVFLEIDVDLSEGSLDWEAYGPNGDLVYSDSTQGKFRDKIKIVPAPGEW